MTRDPSVQQHLILDSELEALWSEGSSRDRLENVKAALEGCGRYEAPPALKAKLRSIPGRRRWLPADYVRVTSQLAVASLICFVASYPVWTGTVSSNEPAGAVEVAFDLDSFARSLAPTGEELRFVDEDIRLMEGLPWRMS